MDVDVSQISPSTSPYDDSGDDSSEDTSDDEEISDDDLGWVSDDEDSDSELSDNKLDATDGHGSDTEDGATPLSFCTQIFSNLKQMYAHCYEVRCQQLPKPPQPFLKHVLGVLKTNQPDHFCTGLWVSPLTFDCLVEAIINDPVFTSHSPHSHQAPVQEQLAVALCRFGHFGNAASLQLVANWAGIGKGTVKLYTHQVMAALLRPEFMWNSVRWPDEEEKESAKKWVERHSCKAWQDGWCFLDGTLVPLASQPYWYGESYYDRKC